MAGKGSSRLDRSNRAQPRHVSEKANHLPSPKHGDDNKGDRSLSAVIKFIATFHGETRSSVSTLQSFGVRMTAVETSLQDCDDRITTLEAKCETLEVQQAANG